MPLALVLLLALMLAAPASAATIEVVGDRLSVTVPNTAAYTAGAVRPLPDGGAIVSLHGPIAASAVTIGPGCVSTPSASPYVGGGRNLPATHAATCTLQGVTTLEVVLAGVLDGQGWDSSAMALPTVLTGSGNVADQPRGDFVATGAGGDVIRLGGIGSDVVEPGDAPRSGSGQLNLIESGGGDDLVNLSAAPGRDTVKGGAGADTVTYQRRFSTVGAPGAPGVRITFDGITNDGVAGEEDNIGTDVENAVGTTLDDFLEGSSAANRLEGREGVDTLRGLSGPDLIVAREPGATTNTGTRDAVSCGLSNPDLSLPDGTTNPGPRDRLESDLADPRPPDCEDVVQMAVDEQAPVRIAGGARLDGGVLRVRLECPAAARRRCTGSVRHAGTGGKAATFDLGARGRATLALRLARPAARSLRRRGGFALVETLETGNEGGVTALRYVRVRP